MEKFKQLQNQIIQSDLSTTSSLFVLTNANIPSKILPFVATSPDAIGNITPEGNYSGHVRSQGGGMKFVYGTKEGMANAVNGTIDVMFIDPSFQYLWNNFMKYCKDIKSNILYYINYDIQGLTAAQISLVNFENWGSLNATSFLQPTTLTFNGNMNASVDIGQVISIITAGINFFKADGVSVYGSELYGKIIQNFEKQALLRS